MVEKAYGGIKLMKRREESAGTTAKKSNTGRTHAVKTVKKAKSLHDLSMFKSDCVTHCK